MRVIVACEFSGRVRDAFIKKGHDAISCDLLDAPGPHIKSDIRDVDLSQYDLMIAHPPCTYIASSGNIWYGDLWDGQKWHSHPFRKQALELVRYLLHAPVERICLENPKGAISPNIRGPQQKIQPYMFGHVETKETHLWLKNLPLLQPTKDVKAEVMALPVSKRHKMAGYCRKNRSQRRSITYQGIADAMALQWG